MPKTTANTDRDAPLLDPFLPSTYWTSDLDAQAGRLDLLRRRSVLLAEARRLLATEGCGFSMRSLADVSEMSVQNIYKSVGTKIETIEAAIKDFNLSVMAISFVDGCYGRSVISMFDIISGMVKAHPDFMRQVTHVMFNNKAIFNGLHDQTTAQLLRLGSISPRLGFALHSPLRRTLIRQLVSMGTLSVYEWSIGACTSDELGPRLHTAAQIFLQGLGFNPADLEPASQPGAGKDLEISLTERAGDSALPGYAFFRSEHPDFTALEDLCPV